MTPPENEHDLRGRVVALEHNNSNVQQRVSELEKWRQVNEISDAKMQVKFEEMDKKLTAIGANTTWLVRLVIGGIILGALGFMLKGGFHVP